MQLLLLLLLLLSLRQGYSVLYSVVCSAVWWEWCYELLFPFWLVIFFLLFFFYICAGDAGVGRALYICLGSVSARL